MGVKLFSSLQELREISRQQYLEKREKKELQLLEKSLKDEEYLFDDVKLSKDEYRINKLNTRIIGLAQDKDRFHYNDQGACSDLSFHVIIICQFYARFLSIVSVENKPNYV